MHASAHSVPRVRRNRAVESAYSTQYLSTLPRFHISQAWAVQRQMRSASRMTPAVAVLLLAGMMSAGLPAASGQAFASAGNGLAVVSLSCRPAPCGALM